MIKLFVNDKKVPYDTWDFPGGEVGVRIQGNIEWEDSVDIYAAGILNPRNIFILLNLCDAVYSLKGTDRNTRVIMPYFPYARQDRVCNDGESFALSVMTDILKTMFIETLEIHDPHSRVTTVLMNGSMFKLLVVPQHQLAEKILNKEDYDVVVSPDAGAAEKAALLYPELKHVYLTKSRVDGKVIYDDFPFDTIKGRILVVDDICDGGRTFVSLGKMLDRTQPGITDMQLYVTHGIFSAGTEQLSSIYSKLFCYNLMNRVEDVICKGAYNV